MTIERDPKKICCHCLGVSFGKIQETIAKERCRTVDDVTRACRAGGGCRSCHVEIEELLRQARPRREGLLPSWLARMFGKE